MKRSVIFCRSTLVLVVSCFFPVCGGDSFAASYTITDLGDLGGSISYALAINDIGQIAGTSYVDRNTYEYHAFLYNNGVLSDLGAISVGSKRFSLKNSH